jgi:hypothetical protein
MAWALVANFKGGVGKTTIAKNLILPYFVERYGKATYVNWDLTDEIERIKDIRHLKVNFKRIEPTGKSSLSSDFEVHMTFLRMLTEEEKVVIDVGPLMAVFDALKAFRVFSDIFSDNLTVVIPVGKRLTEIKAGIETYRKAKENGFKKFLFVLNGYSRWLGEEFELFFKPVREGEPAPVELIEEQDRNIIKFPFDKDGILGKVEELYGRLPYDFLQGFEEFSKEYSIKLKEKKITPEEARKMQNFSETKELFDFIFSEIEKNKDTFERLFTQLRF